MKHIILADLHLSAYATDSQIDGISAKLYNIMKVLKNTIIYARDNDINSVIIAGDVFHSKAMVHTIALNEFINFIRSNYDIEFKMISGNHDVSTKSGTGVSLLCSVEDQPNVKVFNKAEESGSFYYVPWYNNMIEDIKNGPKNKVLIAHFGLNEGKVNSGISIVSDIGLKDLKKYPIGFIGHYHSPQSIKNIHYVGSPIMMDWGEKDEIKRFVVFDDEDGTFQSIPTEGYKKYIEIKLKENDNIKEILEIAKIETINGNEVRFIKLEEIDTSLIDKDFKVISKIEKEVTNRGISSSMSMEEKMERYLKIKEISEERMELYKKEGLKLIQKGE